VQVVLNAYHLVRSPCTVACGSSSCLPESCQQKSRCTEISVFSKQQVCCRGRRNFYLIGALSAAKRAAESIRVGQSPPAPIGGLALSIIREAAPCLRSVINFRSIG
jgi:hypothetical protein